MERHTCQETIWNKLTGIVGCLQTLWCWSWCGGSGCCFKVSECCNELGGVEIGQVWMFVSAIGAVLKAFDNINKT